MQVGKYPLVAKSLLADDVYSFTVSCPEIANQSENGQFVNIGVEGFSLRRPISICEIDKEQGTLRFVFRVVGEGTKKLAQLSVGDSVDLLGPLGHGFTMLPSDKKVVVVGGGIGVPPMLQVAKHYDHAIAVLGFKTSSECILVEDFEKLGCRVELYTDDGSCGNQGFVTAGLEKILQMDKIDMICACGPKPMLGGVAKLAENYGVFCEVSLEERMACGIGACLVCACRLIKDSGEYLGHVCKDGPVFDAKKVVF